MSTVPKKKPVDPRRRQLLGKVHIAKKTLGLDDDAYRDVLEIQTGRRSAADCSNVQLTDLLDHFKSLGFKARRKPPARAGARKLADGEEVAKMRAIWISLYHLAVVRDPSERALANFARRVSGGRDRGTAALQWLDGSDRLKVIEALKEMARRDGGVCWDPYKIYFPGGHNRVHRPRERVITAQWELLMELGEVHLYHGLQGYGARVAGTDSNNTITNMTGEQQDKIIEALGARIRKTLAARDCVTITDFRKATGG